VLVVVVVVEEEEEEEEEEECLAWCSNSYRKNYNFTFGLRPLCRQWPTALRGDHHIGNHLSPPSGSSNTSSTSEITLENSTGEFDRFHF